MSDPKEFIIIAVDGGAAVGKSSTSRGLAEGLDLGTVSGAIWYTVCHGVNLLYLYVAAAILLRQRPGMDRFQVVQATPEQVVIRYVAASELDQDAVDYFRDRIADTCGAGLAVAFERVDDIRAEPGGKFRLVVSRAG